MPTLGCNKSLSTIIHFKMIQSVTSELRTKHNHVCPCLSFYSNKEHSVDGNPLPASSNRRDGLRLSSNWDTRFAHSWKDSSSSFVLVCAKKLAHQTLVLHATSLREELWLSHTTGI